MADVTPFRAVRYSGAAGPLAELVAPPYDAVSAWERERLLTRSPFNVVRLTLPDTADQAGELYRDWLEDGILAREDEPAAWLLVEEYAGPDGGMRQLRGIVVSLLAEPYETAAVLPHERTHPRIRAERLSLLRSTRVQAEPIFVLTDRRLGAGPPDGPPDVEVNGTRLWRLRNLDPHELVAGAQLLIADGHHRYESTLEFGDENRAPEARIMALLVSTDDPGLHVFPTHRVFGGRRDLREPGGGERFEELGDAMAQLSAEPSTRAAAVAYRASSVELLRGGEGELDVELVDRHGLEGISYTHREEEAVRTVDAREADVAFLVRPPRVDDVFARARRGERMPPKSTYFFPKPLSGLLFHPVGS